MLQWYIEAVKSIADYIKFWIDANPLHAQLITDGIVNFSALARTIHSNMTPGLQKDISITSLAAALNRHVKEAGRLIHATDIVETISIQADISRIVFHLTDLPTEQFSKALKILNEVPDFTLSTKNMEEVRIASRRGIIDELATHFHYIEIAHNLAAVTITLKQNSPQLTHALAYILQKFSTANIKLFGAQTSHNELIVIVSKSHAYKVQSLLS